jgi:hypothetical protein
MADDRNGLTASKRGFGGHTRTRHRIDAEGLPVAHVELETWNAMCRLIASISTRTER